MTYLLLLLWAGLVSSFEQQYYDSSQCSSSTIDLGSRYTCNNGSHPPCQAFLLYRANYLFQTVSNISGLFGAETYRVLALNNLRSSSEILKLDTEVFVPINCSCSGEFYYSNVTYIVQEGMPFSEIACGIFEGLVKSSVLVKENPSHESSTRIGSELHVPVKCACPENNSLIGSGVNYFLTYPFKPGDELDKLAKKFGVPPPDVLKANNVTFRSTVFPNTTALFPLKDEPVIEISSFDPSPPVAFPTVPMEKPGNGKTTTKLYIGGSVAAILLLVFGLISCGLYIKALNQLKARKYQSFSTGKNSGATYLSPRPSMPSSCLSPDLLAGIKYSLYKYSIEDLKGATNNFKEDSNIANSISLYRGSIDNYEVMIQQLRFEEAHQIIDAHARINHVNILNLLGICYGDKLRTSSSHALLIFESPENGCLRDCLTRPRTSLEWDRRKQIAFDIATGLHYLHHCITPPHANVTITSEDVFITTDWRAKIGNIAGYDTNHSSSRTDDANKKIGIYTFGIVLLELISGKAVNEYCMINGKKLRESLEFLGGAADAVGNDVCKGSCLEKLREFVDPSLKVDDCQLTEALCFVLLAKACLEDDTLHRPSMNDIMKVLVRVV